MSHETARERLERCRKRAEEKPDSAVTHYNLGLAYTQMRKMTSAEKAYRRALEIDPDMVEAWVNLGGALLSSWDFEGSKKANLEALQRDGNSLLANYNLGQASLYLGDAQGVVDCNRRVVEIDPDHAAGHYFLAVGLLAVNRIDEARQHLSRSMALGHRPSPEFLRGIERTEKQGNEKNTFQIANNPGADAPKDPKED